MLGMKITNPFLYVPLKRVNKNGVRHYDTGEGRLLPSVTTILSSTKDMSAIEEWRESIGEQSYKQIMKDSTETGDRVHKNLEDYILEGKKPTGTLMAKIITRLIIDKGFPKIDEVWGCEVPLYFPLLYAGTTDLVGIHDGDQAIMDFKNSRAVKKDEYVEEYKEQLVSYSEAHNELYKTNIRKGVIMMGTQTGEYAEWIIQGEEYDHYKNKWFERLKEYYRNYVQE